MCDSFVDLVPTDPTFVPPSEARPAILEVARRMFPQADEVTLDDGEHVSFRDAGGNAGSVACPACGAGLDDEWAALMNEDFDGDGFALAQHELPCCGASARLHELVYDPPQGFCRAGLSVRNPNVAEVSGSALRAVEEALGCSALVVYRRM